MFIQCLQEEYVHQFESITSLKQASDSFSSSGQKTIVWWISQRNDSPSCYPPNYAGYQAIADKGVGGVS
jgi:hypothetical protein